MNNENSNNLKIIAIILLGLVCILLAFGLKKQYEICDSIGETTNLVSTRSSELYNAIYRAPYEARSNNRATLVVYIDSEVPADREENTGAESEPGFRYALENGGTIKGTRKSYESSIGYKLSYFGSYEESDDYTFKGALLNYIASEGWELVQADGNTFYFVR